MFAWMKFFLVITLTMVAFSCERKGNEVDLQDPCKLADGTRDSTKPGCSTKAGADRGSRSDDFGRQTFDDKDSDSSTNSNSRELRSQCELLGHRDMVTSCDCSTGTGSVSYKSFSSSETTRFKTELVTTCDRGGRDTPSNPGGRDIPSNPGGRDIPSNPGGRDIPSNPGGRDIPSNPGGRNIPNNPGNRGSDDGSTDAVAELIRQFPNRNDAAKLEMFISKFGDVTLSFKANNKEKFSNMEVLPAKASVTRDKAAISPDLKETVRTTRVSNEVILKVVLKFTFDGKACVGISDLKPSSQTIVDVRCK